MFVLIQTPSYFYYKPFKHFQVPKNEINNIKKSTIIANSEVRTSNKPMGTMKNIQESAITDSGVPKSNN